MNRYELIQKAKEILIDFTEMYPQVNEKTNEVDYYFCGSIVALLYSDPSLIRYLGANKIDVSINSSFIKNTFFNQKVRKFHDLDLVTTNKTSKNEIPCFFIPSIKSWKKVFLPRISFYKSKKNEGIKLDNLYQWNGFFDIVEYYDEKNSKSLYLISPEALVAYKVFEVCFGDKHISDLISFWNEGDFDKKKVKMFIRKNLEFYSRMTEFNTILSMYKKAFLGVKSNNVLSPFLDIFDQREIEEIIKDNIKESCAFQKEIYKKIKKSFIDLYKSQMTRK